MPGLPYTAVMMSHQATATPGTGDPQVGPAATQPVAELRIATLTFAHGALHTFVMPGPHWADLPKARPIEGESLDETAKRVLRANLGFSEQYMEQLYTLSHENGDGWSIIVSYLALVCTEGDLAPAGNGRWLPVSAIDELTPGDRKVIDYALFRLRAKLGYTTIAFHLMPELFTLSELQSVFETILGRRLDKRNFRRRMATLGILAVSRKTRRDGSHRPARLYRFLSDRDPTDYLTPPWASAKPGE